MKTLKKAFKLLIFITGYLNKKNCKIVKIKKKIKKNLVIDSNLD